MCEEMLSLMAALASGAVASTVAADELVDVAGQVEDQRIAELLRRIARYQRVEALKFQGCLAAASAQYTERFGSE